MKHIIKEVEPECTNLMYYFDDDGIREAGGDYCFNVFVIESDRWGRVHGIQAEEYEKIVKQAEAIVEGFSEVEETSYYVGAYTSYKEVMQDNGISYNPTKCSKLKKWYSDYKDSTVGTIAAFLTITTGKYWADHPVRGYCQGDYCEVLYCPEYNSNPQRFGEVYLGCAKEFCVIDLDENGEEADACYGYIVSDCEAFRDEEYKKLVSEWAGIKPEDCTLEMIDGCSTHATYNYRTT